MVKASVTVGEFTVNAEFETQPEAVNFVYWIGTLIHGKGLEHTAEFIERRMAELVAQGTMEKAKECADAQG